MNVTHVDAWATFMQLSTRYGLVFLLHFMGAIPNLRATERKKLHGRFTKGAPVCCHIHAGTCAPVRRPFHGAFELRRRHSVHIPTTTFPNVAAMTKVRGSSRGAGEEQQMQKRFKT